MPTKEFFVREFSDVDTEELLRRAVTRDLTDEASAAIAEVLRGRNIDAYEMPERLLQAKKDVLRESDIANRCDCCGKTLLSRVTDGGQKFCSAGCLETTRALEASLDMPDGEITKYAQALRNGACPSCRKSRPPNEIHQTYTIVSAVFVSVTTRTPKLSCRQCRKKFALQAIGVCCLAGWWSPKGFFMTIARIYQNVATMLAKDGNVPSPTLLGYARIELGKKAIDRAKGYVSG